MEKYTEKESYAGPVQSSLGGWRERFKDFYYCYPWLIVVLHIFLIQAYLILPGEVPWQKQKNEVLACWRENKSNTLIALNQHNSNPEVRHKKKTNLTWQLILCDEMIWCPKHKCERAMITDQGINIIWRSLIYILNLGN